MQSRKNSRYTRLWDKGPRGVSFVGARKRKRVTLKSPLYMYQKNANKIGCEADI